MEMDDKLKEIPLLEPKYYTSPKGKKAIYYYHRKLKVWKCSYKGCNKQYNAGNTNDSIIYHLLSQHLKERPYECPKCGKTFYHVGHRNKHLNLYCKFLPEESDISEKLPTEKLQLKRKAPELENNNEKKHKTETKLPSIMSLTTSANQSQIGLSAHPSAFKPIYHLPHLMQIQVPVPMKCTSPSIAPTFATPIIIPQIQNPHALEAYKLKANLFAPRLINGIEVTGIYTNNIWPV